MKTLILVLILVITSGCASNYHKCEIRGLENSVNVPLQNNVDIREEDNDKKLY